MLGTPSTRCAWSETLWWTRTRGPEPLVDGASGAGVSVSRAGMSPSSSSSFGHQVVADLAAEPDDHALGVVPAVEVALERLARRRADGLLAADDVPAERLVAVEELLVQRRR